MSKAKSFKNGFMGNKGKLSVLNNTEMVKKCIKDRSLSKALRLYAEEVAEERRSLYGIYKIIEELAANLREVGGGDGSQLLGKLAGHSKKYIKDLKQSTQHKRHARTQARKVLSEEECRKRVKIIIEAYANFIR